MAKSTSRSVSSTLIAPFAAIPGFVSSTFIEYTLSLYAKVKMSPTVRQEKFRKAFSRTALGSDISRKDVDWASSLTNWPEGRSVDFICRRSPGSRKRVSSI